MPAPIRTIRPGEPISAAVFNQLVDALNALGQISGAYPIEVEHDSAGVRISIAHQFKAWLFRIQFVPSTVPRTDDNVPYYSATRLRLDTSNNYAPQSPQDVRLYDPLAANAPSKILVEGTWVLATYDADAGRWHIVRDPFVSPAIVRFKLTATLTLGGSAAAVIRKWDPTAGGGSGAYVDGDAITVKDYFGALGDPGEWQAPNGYYGFAVKIPDLGEYQILYMERQARFAVATLTSDMSGGTASATFASFWEGRSTGSVSSIKDRDGNHANLRTGDKAIVTWDNKLEQYVVITGKIGGEPQLFYLNENLARGGSADANLRVWDGGTSTWLATGAEVEVFDSSKMGPATTTTLGVCFLSSQSGRYEIISLPQQSGQIRYGVAYDNMVLDTVAKSKDHYIMVQICTDETYSDPSGDPFPVYCASASSATEPNGQSGSHWKFIQGTTGRCEAVGGNYLDDYRGAVKNHMGPEATIPYGWLLCNGQTGTNNGVTFTTPDLTARFVLGGTDAGGTTMDDDGNTNAIGQQGGKLKHKHADHQPLPCTYTTLTPTTFVPSIDVIGYIAPAVVTGYAFVPSQIVSGNINPTSLSVETRMTGTPYASGQTDPTALSIETSGDPIDVDVDLSGHTGYSTTGIIVVDPFTGRSYHPTHYHGFIATNTCIMEENTPTEGQQPRHFLAPLSLTCTSPTACSGADAQTPVYTDPASTSVMSTDEIGNVTGFDPCGHPAETMSFDHRVVEPTVSTDHGTEFGHNHTISGTATVTLDTSDLGLTITPNPHYHTITYLPVSGITFSPSIVTPNPHTHTFDLKTYSTSATLYTDPHTHDFSLRTVSTSATTTITPNPHTHNTPKLTHSLEYHTPQYFALAYIMRAY